MGKGKEEDEKKITRQKSPGNRAKQECAALIKAAWVDIMDDQKLASKRD